MTFYDQATTFVWWLVNPWDNLDDNGEDLLMTLMTTDEDLLTTLTVTGKDPLTTRDDEADSHCDVTVLWSR